MFLKRIRYITRVISIESFIANPSIIVTRLGYNQNFCQLRLIYLLIKFVQELCVKDQIQVWMKLMYLKSYCNLLLHLVLYL